ncbi:hypothetical protein IHQ68_09335 [Chelatococcus sambhunathii]|uniref:Uncharacterized protein n=1 Tax=Chelatococcus sambhunathii TaxID=363953 RepID=A0ABU1DFJ7_9HYPH|nr:hypothetical protein [Chelatococcus sambhunathii]MDR4306820.1 hypothetical protein [Chelatococcus sambhunathii]
MGSFADREAIDTLAAIMFSRDHPDRSWDPLTDPSRLGVATAVEKAVYRGFATARLAAEEREVREAAVAAAALAAHDKGFKPRV